MRWDRLSTNFKRNAPVSDTDIEQFETRAGLKLPTDYADFLKWSNGGEGFIGDNAYAALWKLGDLAERNEANGVAEFAPGFFLFGSDGGGEAFAFDARTPAMPVVCIPFIVMEPSAAILIGLTFVVSSMYCIETVSRMHRSKESLAD